MQVLGYGPRESKPRVKSELRKQQYTVTLSDYKNLGQCNGYLIGKYKIYVILPLLLCFSLYLRAISKYKPPGVYFRRGDLTEGFCVTSLGEGGLYLEELIFGIFGFYQQWN